MYQDIVSQYYLLMMRICSNTIYSGKNLEVIRSQLKEDLPEIQEWLNCNKLSLNVLQTHYMIFTPINKIIEDIDIQLYGVNIQRVFVTNFLGSKLTLI